jgi:hypothetical protein
MRQNSFFFAICCALLLSAVLTGCASTNTVASGENFLGNYPPQKIKTVMLNSLNEKKLTLDPVEVSFVLYPKTNIVEMKLFYQFNQTIITFTKSNRDVLLSALQKYIDDYQSGALTVQDSTVKSYFGETKIDYLWGLMTPVYFARPIMRFEFRYVTPKKPYFLIKNDIYPQIDQNGYPVKDSAATTPTLRLAISPLQGKELLDCLNQEALKKIVADLDAKQEQFDIPAQNTDSSEKPELF